MKIQTINPATEEGIAEYSLTTATAALQYVLAADAQFHLWRKTSFAERRALMLKLASRLREKQEEYAILMATEMGKPLKAGRAEIIKSAFVCEHYASHAEHYLTNREIPLEMKKAMVCYQPLGVIFAIMPWNFPFWQVFRFAAPNIMAGNVGLLKHAPISTGVGEAIMALFLEVGFPKHVFSTLVIDNSVAATVIAHEKIAGVTLTGSEQAGKTVASHAMMHLKKVVLELGGNDPYLVLADADLTLAADCIVSARLNNSGQTCIAPKRVIVVKKVADALIEMIIQGAKQYCMGDPMNPETTLGPMARRDLRDTLHQQVLASIASGAQLLLGGKLPKGPGFYYPPTILSNVTPGMAAFDEELFGPVFAITIAVDESDAIRLANQTRFGLGSAVFTSDLARGEKIAIHELNSGSAFVNGYVVSDPRLPFGGIKHSGFGRELSQEGILEFMNTKTVVIDEST